MKLKNQPMGLVLFIGVVVVLNSCTSAPEKKTYADFASSNLALNKPNPGRIIVGVDKICDEENMCLVQAKVLDNMMQIITNFNDEIKKRTDAYNTLLNDGVTHCEWANYNLEQSLFHSDKALARSELMNTVKSVLGAGVCGALLLFK